MIIGICGLGYTGSGAVFDFLKEFIDYETLETEFNLTYYPCGIQDLDYHLNISISRYYSSDSAIKNFEDMISIFDSPKSEYRKRMKRSLTQLAHEYVGRLKQVEWNGYWTFDAYRYSKIKRFFRFKVLNLVNHFFEKIIKRKKIDTHLTMSLCIKPQNFVSETKKFICRVLQELGLCDSKYIVLNQPFEGNAPEQSMIYFEDPYAIIVDKDPRDLYILIKKIIKDEGAFVPTDNVEDFVKYYKLLRKDETKDTNRILHVRFEDLIYEYDATTSKILDFLHINEKNENKYRFFNPQKSINNTQLFLRFPDLKDDIKYIEANLGEYLYDFNAYELKPNGGKPF